jgi:hypothetical protein
MAAPLEEAARLQGTIKIRMLGVSFGSVFDAPPLECMLEWSDLLFCFPRVRA